MSRHLKDVRHLGLVTGPGPVLVAAFDDPPDRLQFARVRREAAKLLPADELEARLALYAARAERFEPVCTGGEPDAQAAAEAARVEAGGVAHTVCWACGCPAGRQGWVESIGWETRPVWIGGQSFRESYCRPCFHRWGWPAWRP